MAEPTIEEIAKIIGRAPTDLCEDGCDAACETDGGTCICAELHSTAATVILTRFRRSEPEVLAALQTLCNAALVIDGDAYFDTAPSKAKLKQLADAIAVATDAINKATA